MAASHGVGLGDVSMAASSRVGAGDISMAASSGVSLEESYDCLFHCFL